MPLEANEALRFKIKVSGKEYQQSESGGVEQISIEDHVDIIGMAEIKFSAASSDTWSTHKIGNDVEAVGGGDSKPAFKGYITEIRSAYAKGQRTFSVVAMDPLCKLAASRVTKVYEEVTDSDIVSTVLGRAGVTAGTVDSTSGQSKYVIQRNESDLFFLKRLAARNGYLLMAKEGKVDFKKVQYTDTPTKIKNDNIIFLEWAWSTAQVPKDITVIGWDYLTKEKVEGTAAAGDLEPIGGGADAVAETGKIWQDKSYVSDVMVATQTGAKDMAVSEINRLARTALRGRAVVQGNTALRAGTRVKFEGGGAELNPEGYIISSRHTFDEAGYLTEIHFVGNTKPT
jgi:phage protein D